MAVVGFGYSKPKWQQQGLWGQWEYMEAGGRGVAHELEAWRMCSRSSNSNCQAGDVRANEPMVAAGGGC